MITVWELSSSKKEVLQKSLDRWQFGKSLTWVDCFRPSEEDINEISKKTGISSQILKESTDSAKRPHLAEFGSYSRIVFRGLYEENKKWNTAPVGIFLFKKDIITLHYKPIIGLDNIRKMPKESLLDVFRKGAPFFLYTFMSSVVDEFFSLFEDIDDEISRLEDEVVKNSAKFSSQSIFAERRKLIYTYKSLIANREVLSSLEKQYIKEFRKEEIMLLRDLYNDIEQLIDMAATYRDLLTSILDMYLGSINNNLNRVMKVLTVVSTFILVPTLISGIYGMNFQRVSPWSMPELYWNYGYLFALGLMLLSAVITYIVFRKKGWL